MSLDPQTAALMDAMKEREMPPFTKDAVPLWRENFDAMCQMLARPETEVAKEETREVAGVRCTVTWPKESAGALPVAIHIHGGGWTIGSLEGYAASCRYYADAMGAIVVSVDYRLAPEHPYPAAIEDCMAVFEWLAQNAAELGGDPARIGVFGDSAGGNLSAAVALLARDKNLPLAAQGLIYPCTDLRPSANDTYPSRVEQGTGYVLSPEEINFFGQNYVPDAARAAEPAASPILGEVGGVAPAFVIVAGHDPLHDEGVAYAEKLKTAGISIELASYPGTVHGFLSFCKAVPSGLDAQAKLAAWMKARLSAG